MAIYDNRICKQCGKKFSGGPRAWYCPGCRYERKKERERVYKRSEPARKLGSIDLCVNCGRPYTVSSGLQKYCPDCAEKCVSEIDRKQGLNWYNQNKDYVNERRCNKRKSPKKEITCKICGKTFLGHENQKLCSEECRSKNRKIYSRDYERNHPDRKKKQEAKTN